MNLVRRTGTEMELPHLYVIYKEKEITSTPKKQTENWSLVGSISLQGDNWGSENVTEGQRNSGRRKNTKMEGMVLIWARTIAQWGGQDI